MHSQYSSVPRTYKCEVMSLHISNICLAIQPTFLPEVQKMCSRKGSRKTQSSIPHVALEAFELVRFQTGNALQPLEQSTFPKSYNLRSLMGTKCRSLDRQLRLDAALNLGLVKRCLLSEDEQRAGQAPYRFAD